MSEIPVERLQQALQRAHTFFLDARSRSKEAKAFMRDRGMSEAIAREYALGYAPRDWQALINAIDDTEAAVATGLAARAPSGHVYAAYRDRFMFPVCTASGDLVGFGGRAVANDAAPKYLSSRSTALFNKRELLYGLPQVLAGDAVPRIAVGEGFMDVVMPAQHGVRYMVAAMGTALTAEHMQLLFAYTDEVVLCLDSDAAGTRALERALVPVLPLLSSCRRVRLAQLPAGDDPDSFAVAQGGAALRTTLDNAPMLADHLVDRYADTSKPAREAFDQLRPLLLQIRDPMTQSDVLTRFAARYADVTPASLVRDDEQLTYLGAEVAYGARAAPPLGAPLLVADARVLIARALFACPDVARFADVPAVDALLGDPALRQVARVAEGVKSNAGVTGAQLVRSWADDESTRQFAQDAMRGGVLSPALAREAITAACQVLLERSQPGLAAQEESPAEVLGF